MSLEQPLQPVKTPEKSVVKENVVIPQQEPTVPEKVKEQETEETRITQADEIRKKLDKIMEKSEQSEGGVEKANIEIDLSAKMRGSDFVESLQRVSNRLKRVDEEAEVVSAGIIGKFRNATRNLGEMFQGKALDVEGMSLSLNRIAGAFDDISLINDRELGRITNDAKKSLTGAIADLKDSASQLRRVESMAQLSKNINNLINKADEALFRLRKSLK